jgi:N utilization substance protein B
LGEIDRQIRQHAPLWPVNQLPVVDRNILRQAILEILFVQGVPTKVVINEAIELAKTFGSESSPRFVNGVLGSLVDESQKAKDVELEPAIATAENHIQEGS